MAREIHGNLNINNGDLTISGNIAVNTIVSAQYTLDVSGPIRSNSVTSLSSSTALVLENSANIQTLNVRGDGSFIFGNNPGGVISGVFNFKTNVASNILNVTNELGIPIFKVSQGQLDIRSVGNISEIILRGLNTVTATSIRARYTGDHSIGVYNPDLSEWAHTFITKGVWGASKTIAHLNMANTGTVKIGGNTIYDTTLALDVRSSGNSKLFNINKTSGNINLQSITDTNLFNTNYSTDSIGIGSLADSNIKMFILGTTTKIWGQKILGQLAANGVGLESNVSSTTNSYGLRGVANLITSGTEAYGVEGISTGSVGTNHHGVVGKANGGSNFSIGVQGLINAGGTVASFFRTSAIEGVNSSSISLLNYGGYFKSINTATGAKSYGSFNHAESNGTGTTTSIGGYFNAINGTNNYAAIFDNGNVGIGTLTPTAKLHIVGNTSIINTVATTTLGSPAFKSLNGISSPTDTFSLVSFYNEFRPTTDSGPNLVTAVGNFMYPNITTSTNANSTFYSDVSTTAYTGNLSLLSNTSFVLNASLSLIDIETATGTYNGTMRVNTASFRNIIAGGVINDIIFYMCGFDGGVAHNGVTNNMKGFYMPDQSSIVGVPNLLNRYGVYIADIASNYFAGSVGIGVVSPGGKLHINGGDIKIEGLTDANLINTNYTTDSVGIGVAAPLLNAKLGMKQTTSSAITIYGDKNSTSFINTGSITYKHIRSSDINNTIWQIDTYTHTASGELVSSFAVGPQNTGAFSITTRTTGFTYERLRIINNGNVGLNTSTPTENLDVNGNARFRAIGAGTSAGVLNYTSTGVLTTATSDIRLKTEINTIDNALNKVKNLRGVYYKWKEDVENNIDNKRIGFIAQEIDKVVPELAFINENSDDKFMGVHYQDVTALLVESVKDLSIDEYTPISTKDKYGQIGKLVIDSNYLYVKTKTGWKRTIMESF